MVTVGIETMLAGAAAESGPSLPAASTAAIAMLCAPGARSSIVSDIVSPVERKATGSVSAVPST